MVDLIFDTAKIAGGLLLAQVLFMKSDMIDETVSKVTAWLSGFQAIIGGVLLGLGLFYLLDFRCNLMDAAAIAAGLLLLGVSLETFPAVGKLLYKASNALKAFAVPIGVAAIVSGILGFMDKCL